MGLSSIESPYVLQPPREVREGQHLLGMRESYHRIPKTQRHVGHASQDGRPNSSERGGGRVVMRERGCGGRKGGLGGDVYLRLVIASPLMGGPGKVGKTPSAQELKRKRAFFKQMAENSRVGAGMAADWWWESRLEGTVT